MNRGVWIIIFSVLLAAVAGVVALVVVANRRPYIPVDLGKTPQPKSPAETKVTDQRIVRLEVQLKAPDQKTRVGAMLELAGIAHSILGLFGLIDERLDVDLVHEVAAAVHVAKVMAAVHGRSWH